METEKFTLNSRNHHIHMYCKIQIFFVQKWKKYHSHCLPALAIATSLVSRAKLVFPVAGKTREVAVAGQIINGAIVLLKFIVKIRSALFS